MTAFGFLAHNFGRWWGPTNCYFALKNATSVVLTMRGGGDTKTLLDGKFELYALTACGDAKTFQFSLAP